MSVIVSCSHLATVLGLLDEEDGGRGPTLGPMAAVRTLEVVEPRPGLQVGVDRHEAGVVAVAEGDPVVEREDGPLEALDESIEVGAARRDPMLADTRERTGLAEAPGELGAVVGRRDQQVQAGSADGRQAVAYQEARHLGGGLAPQRSFSMP